MRKFLLLTTMAAAFACVFSCTKKGEEPKPVIESPQSIDAPSIGGEVSFAFNVTGVQDQSALEAKSDDSWIVQLTVEGNNVRFFAAANNTERRSGTITLSYPGADNVDVTVVQDAEQSGNTDEFDITIKASATTAEANVKPKDDEATYIILAYTKDEYQSYANDQEVISATLKYYDNIGGADKFLNKGDATVRLSNLQADCDHVAVVFGYDGTEATTAVHSEDFRTDVLPAPETVRFTFEISEITGTTVNARITPEPVAYKYVTFAIKASDRESLGEDVAKWDAFVKGEADKFIQSGAISSYEDYVKNAGKTEQFYVQLQNLEYGTQYYVIAAIVDQSLNVLAMPGLSEMFTTLPKADKAPVITLECTEYFDGNEVAEKYPQFSKYAGKAIVPVKCTFENSKYWVAGSMDRNIYDTYLSANYLEIALVQMSMCIEKITSDDYAQSPFVHFFTLTWGQNVAVTSIAYDNEAKGTKSEFSTVFVDAVSDGAADVSEFEKYL